MYLEALEVVLDKLRTVQEKYNYVQCALCRNNVLNTNSPSHRTALLTELQTKKSCKKLCPSETKSYNYIEHTKYN